MSNAREIFKISKTEFCLLHLNIQSVRTSIDELEDLLQNQFPAQVVSLNEHWLTSSELDFYVPKGYKIGSSFCRLGGYGGSLILIKENISFEIVNVSRFALEKDFEICAIKLKQSNIIIISIYSSKPNNTNFVDILETYLDSLIKSKCKFFYFK